MGQVFQLVLFFLDFSFRRLDDVDGYDDDSEEKEAVEEALEKRKLRWISKVKREVAGWMSHVDFSLLFIGWRRHKP